MPEVKKKGRFNIIAGFRKHYRAYFVGLFACYVMLVGLVYVFQRRILHFPARYDHATLLRRVTAIHGTLWPNGEAYRGILFAPAPEKCRGTILLFHGNAGSATNNVFYAKQLVPFGFRVILAEYAGYGNRAGALDEQSLAADVGASIRLAYEQFGPPVFLIGESLGTGLAAAGYAHAQTPVAGIVLIAPWDKLIHVAQAVYWFLPATSILKDAYDSEANLKPFAGPLAIIQASNDGLIPAAATTRLFESFQGKKRLWKLEGATHWSWSEFADAAFWTQLTDYLTK